MAEGKKSGRDRKGSESGQGPEAPGGKGASGRPSGRKSARLAKPAAPAPQEGQPGPVASTGGLDFNPEIITQIAEREVSEIEGVTELTGGWRTRGVQITEPAEGEEDGYVLDIRVAVEYGVNCLALAETLRTRVAGAIEQMTGRRTKAINVHVTGIREKGLREEPHEEGPSLGEEHGIDF